MWIFSCAGFSAPTPHVAQASTVMNTCKFNVQIQDWKDDIRRESTRRDPSTNKWNLDCISKAAWQITIKRRKCSAKDLKTLIVYEKKSMIMFPYHAHYTKINSYTLSSLCQNLNIKICNKIKVNLFLALG